MRGPRQPRPWIPPPPPRSLSSRTAKKLFVYLSVRNFSTEKNCPHGQSPSPKPNEELFVTAKESVHVFNCIRQVMCRENRNRKKVHTAGVQLENNGNYLPFNSSGELPMEELRKVLAVPWSRKQTMKITIFGRSLSHHRTHNHADSAISWCVEQN